MLSMWQVDNVLVHAVTNMAQQCLRMGFENGWQEWPIQSEFFAGLDELDVLAKLTRKFSFQSLPEHCTLFSTLILFH